MGNKALAPLQALWGSYMRVGFYMRIGILRPSEEKLDSAFLFNGTLSAWEGCHFYLLFVFTRQWEREF
mgnify:CR=1 FL=1